MSRTLALTGAAAAAWLKLDGFREHDWPPLWCAPINCRAGASVLRTRSWEEPTEVRGVLVAPVRLVLRQLAVGLAPLARWDGDRRPLTVHELVELAVEHALRDKEVLLSDLASVGARTPSARVLSDVLAMRPRGEPATGSYAETRAVQVLRGLGYPPLWRQIEIVDGSRHLNTVDLVVPSGGVARPAVMRPELGLLMEIDSRGYHAMEEGFEHDQRRDTNYHALGYRFVAFTPTQIERDPVRVAAAIDGARSARHVGPQRRARPNDGRRCE